MSNLQDLLEYISASPTLLLFGAGPSCELGLPSWNLLAQKVYCELRGCAKITLHFLAGISQL